VYRTPQDEPEFSRGFLLVTSQKGMCLKFRPNVTGPGRQSYEPFFWLNLFWKLDDHPRLQSPWLNFWHVWNQSYGSKTSFYPKIRKLQKSTSFSLAACADSDNSPGEYDGELFEPSKDTWSLLACTEIKNFEMWAWGFRWMSSVLRYVFLFWVFLLWRYLPDNEPNLWLKVRLDPRLWYESLEA